MKNFPNPPHEGLLVHEFDVNTEHGTAHIEICGDSCRDKSPEEVRSSLERIADIYLTEWQNGRCKSQQGFQSEACCSSKTSII